MREIITIPEELKLAASDFSKSNFCILEDVSRKNYIIFDIKKDWRYMIIPFGEILSIMINNLLDSNNNTLHHKELLKIVPIDSVETMKKCRPMLNNLLSIISSMENDKNYPDKIALKCAYIREWKRFRYMNCTAVFSQYSSYFKDSKNCVDEKEYCKEAELKEMTESMHRLVIENFFIPYDIVYARCSECWFYGKTWFASDIDYLFSQDLYHLFVDNLIEAPHICPRCGHFYYSNNNKSKYCDQCKNNYNDIRKEYRQKNQARYIHKRINDMLHSKRFSEMDLNNFMVESNFYWDIVRQNTPKTQKEHWYKDIKNEEEYKEWLESKLQEYSTRK